MTEPIVQYQTFWRTLDPVRGSVSVFGGRVSRPRETGLGFGSVKQLQPALELRSNPTKFCAVWGGKTINQSFDLRG